MIKILTITAENFTTIFENFNAQIYRFVFLRINQNQHLAEDLTQEVFLRVWRGRQQYNPNRASLRTWIFQIARNVVVDHYRQAGRAHAAAQMSTELDTEQHDPADTDVNVELETETAALTKLVIARLQQLPPNERELLQLRYIDQLEIAEIAQITSRSQIATKVAVHRALHKLSKFVNADIK